MAADLDGEALEPAVAAVLELLFDDASGACSLARLSKHAGLAMSSLKRLLTAFEEAGLVVVAVDAKGRAIASLTQDGRAVVASAPPDQRAAAATSRPTSFNADSISDDQA